MNNSLPELNKVYCEDCLEFMAKIPSESIDLVVTSPPYNIRNSSGGSGGGNKGKWAKSNILNNGYDNHNDNMPWPKYYQWQRKCLIEMLRVIKNNGAIFYNHKWRIQNGILIDNKEIIQDLPIRQIIIWQRDGGFNFNETHFLPTYEIIYLITKDKFRLIPKANGIGDIWKIGQRRNSKHPAPFPLELPKRCIMSTNAKLIFDPFMGSGTTALAALSLGRQWLGCDNSKLYCEMTRKRVANYANSKFWKRGK